MPEHQQQHRVLGHALDHALCPVLCLDHGHDDRPGRRQKTHAGLFCSVIVRKATLVSEAALFLVTPVKARPILLGFARRRLNRIALGMLITTILPESALARVSELPADFALR